MLHQPALTFKPSQPAPAAAQPFDAKRYLQRARALGIMVFPTILSDGPTFGLCAYPGYSWSKGNEGLAKEFSATMNAASDTTEAVFEALCADFEIKPTDDRFNDKVGAVCHARSQASTEGDKRLIELCLQAKAALERDIVLTDINCDVTEAYENAQPKRPTYVTAMGEEYTEPKDAATMRATLKESMAEWSRPAIAKYRARIANVVAYEKECERIGREIGVRRARAAEDAASARAKYAVANIAELPATTSLGLAHKAALLPLWKKAGYGLDDEGEALAFSIADDARLLGTGGPLGGRSRQPSISAH